MIWHNQANKLTAHQADVDKTIFIVDSEVALNDN
jgi:hypothetical protein